MHSIWEEFSRLIFHVEVDIQPSDAEAAFAPPAEEPSGRRYSGGGPAQPSALAEAEAGAVAMADPDAAAQAATPSGNGADVVETKVKSDHEKLGRNDPCWCGSGKKYKKCHGA
jgi:preprotein translocase subunit SecA